MRLPINDDNAFHLRVHLSRFIKEKYGCRKIAAREYGVSVPALKKVVSGKTNPPLRLLCDAGVTVTASWPKGGE